jgi:hypothetical protein
VNALSQTSNGKQWYDKCYLVDTELHLSFSHFNFIRGNGKCEPQRPEPVTIGVCQDGKGDLADTGSFPRILARGCRQG